MLEQPVPNPLAANPRFNTHKVLAAVGIILVFAILVVGGVWIYLGGANTTNPVEDNSIKVATSSSTKDETADWKTYTNTTIGYSVKLPKTWLTTENLASNPSCSGDKTVDYFAPTKETFVICGSDKTSMVSIISQKGTYPTDKTELLNALKNGTVENTKIDNNTAVKVSGEYYIAEGATGNNGAVSITYYVNHQGNYLTIWYVSKSDYKKIFDQIVSTFKFL